MRALVSERMREGEEERAAPTPDGAPDAGHPAPFPPRQWRPPAAFTRTHGLTPHHSPPSPQNARPPTTPARRVVASAKGTKGFGKGGGAAGKGAAEVKVRKM